ncbi:unnamed protein product [Bemisia tabaci]|uniref:AAA-ATPase-like domain-containing protein n=1 Tax=Bemisia tabaci TaxID=7038 RepID=A0A9P0AGN1_BEMTA|nr:unnamed protein product [Bemisia tabaci]
MRMRYVENFLALILSIFHVFAMQIADFKGFIENHHNLYVDKTQFLLDFIFDKEEGVVFITRPQGFGKSLLASTVDYFFNSRYDVSQSERLFAGLNVMADTPIAKQFREEHMNRFPVIKISFASFQATDFRSALKEVERMFKQKTQEKFQDEYGSRFRVTGGGGAKGSNSGLRMSNDIAVIHTPLPEVNDSPSNGRVMEDHGAALAHSSDPILHRIANGTADEQCLRVFVQLLSFHVIEHHRVAPILIIDAYDTPLYSAYDDTHYENITELMAHLLDLGPYANRFRKVLTTGVATVKLDRVQLRKEGTNDHNPLSGFFGFSKVEVMALLKRNGKNEEIDRTRVENFGGYGFRDSNVTVYNPSGVIRYVDSGTVDGGLDAASTSILKDLLTVEKYGLYPILVVQKLLAYELVPRHVIHQLHYPSIRRIPSHFWTFLVSLGFATYDLEKAYHSEAVLLKIPNLNAYKFLALTIAKNPKIPDYNGLTKSLIEGDFKTAQKVFRTYLAHKGAYVTLEDKDSEKYDCTKHKRLSDYANELLEGVKIRYKTGGKVLHRPGLDYIELEPSGDYVYTIRIRIEKSKMLKALWYSVRNKVCSLVKTVPKNETEIFIQYGTSFFEVCLRQSSTASVPRELV